MSELEGLDHLLSPIFDGRRQFQDIDTGFVNVENVDFAHSPSSIIHGIKTCFTGSKNSRAKMMAILKQQFSFSNLKF